MLAESLGGSKKKLPAGFLGRKFPQVKISNRNKINPDFQLVSNMIKAEPVDIEELTKKRSRRGRKRKTTESENELTRSYEREDNEYKKKRLRNNIAVRKSRDKGRFIKKWYLKFMESFMSSLYFLSRNFQKNYMKSFWILKAKQRQLEVQKKLIALAEENKTQKAIIERIKNDYDVLEARFDDLNSRLEESLKERFNFISTKVYRISNQFNQFGPLIFKIALKILYHIDTEWLRCRDWKFKELLKFKKITSSSVWT